jgi:voltage-gated potassium channel Kch
MSFEAPTLLAILVAALTAAYLLGMATRALRLPPLVGYLLAGAKAGHPEDAKLLVVAIPNRILALRAIELARAANPRIDVVVRTHSDAEAEWLGDREVGLVVMSERETALGIAEYALRRFGAEPGAARTTLDELRRARPKP